MPARLAVEARNHRVEQFLVVRVHEKRIEECVIDAQSRVQLPDTVGDAALGAGGDSLRR